MSDNPLARHGGLSYLHIPTRDAKKSAAFYERYVDGIDAALERATASDGRVDPMRAEGDIRVVEIQDPAGNRLGLWQFA